MCNRIGYQKNDCICDVKIGEQVIALGNGLVYEVVGFSLVSKTPIVMRIGVNPFIITNSNWRKYTPPKEYEGWVNLYEDPSSPCGFTYGALQKSKALSIGCMSDATRKCVGRIQIKFKEGEGL